MPAEDHDVHCIDFDGEPVFEHEDEQRPAGGTRPGRRRGCPGRPPRRCSLRKPALASLILQRVLLQLGLRLQRLRRGLASASLQPAEAARPLRHAAAISISASDFGRPMPSSRSSARLLRLRDQSTAATARRPRCRRTRRPAAASADQDMRTGVMVQSPVVVSVSGRRRVASRVGRPLITRLTRPCHAHTLMFTIFLITYGPEQLQRRWRRRAS